MECDATGGSGAPPRRSSSPAPWPPPRAHPLAARQGPVVHGQGRAQPQRVLLLRGQLLERLLVLWGEVAAHLGVRVDVLAVAGRGLLAAAAAPEPADPAARRLGAPVRGRRGRLALLGRVHLRARGAQISSARAPSRARRMCRAQPDVSSMRAALKKEHAPLHTPGGRPSGPCTGTLVACGGRGRGGAGRRSAPWRARGGGRRGRWARSAGRPWTRPPRRRRPGRSPGSACTRPRSACAAARPARGAARRSLEAAVQVGPWGWRGLRGARARCP